MRYFKTAEGKILCTFIRHEGTHRHEIVYRSKDIAGNPAIALHPSPEVPSERDHGKMIEISEAEALAIDPGLFEKGFADYEEYKRWEALQIKTAPEQKRKVRESAVQEALF